ncbi:hypothetical protein ACTXT7_004832 [Hymenolepis weldensis]
MLVFYPQTMASVLGKAAVISRFITVDMEPLQASEDISKVRLTSSHLRHFPTDKRHFKTDANQHLALGATIGSRLQYAWTVQLCMCMPIFEQMHRQPDLADVKRRSTYILV